MGPPGGGRGPCRACDVIARAGAPPVTSRRLEAARHVPADAPFPAELSRVPGSAAVRGVAARGSREPRASPLVPSRRAPLRGRSGSLGGLAGQGQRLCRGRRALRPGSGRRPRSCALKQSRGRGHRRWLRAGACRPLAGPLSAVRSTAGCPTPLPAGKAVRAAGGAAREGGPRGTAGRWAEAPRAAAVVALRPVPVAEPRAQRPGPGCAVLPRRSGACYSRTSRRLRRLLSAVWHSPGFSEAAVTARRRANDARVVDLESASSSAEEPGPESAGGSQRGRGPGGRGLSRGGRAGRVLVGGARGGGTQAGGARAGGAWVGSVPCGVRSSRTVDADMQKHERGRGDSDSAESCRPSIRRPRKELVSVLLRKDTERLPAGTPRPSLACRVDLGRRQRQVCAPGQNQQGHLGWAVRAAAPGRAISGSCLGPGPQEPRGELLGPGAAAGSWAPSYAPGHSCVCGRDLTAEALSPGGALRARRLLRALRLLRADACQSQATRPGPEVGAAGVQTGSGHAGSPGPGAGLAWGRTCSSGARCPGLSATPRRPAAAPRTASPDPLCPQGPHSGRLPYPRGPGRSPHCAIQPLPASSPLPEGAGAARGTWRLSAAALSSQPHAGTSSSAPPPMAHPPQMATARSPPQPQSHRPSPHRPGGSALASGADAGRREDVRFPSPSGGDCTCRAGYVEITLQDINDNPPVFPTDLLDLAVEENIGDGAKIVQLTAVDADEGANALVTYAIVSGADDSFRIDPESGDLIATRRLDRERRAKYSLLVRADDGLQSSDVRVGITVRDLNDHVPGFSRPVYAFDLPEDTAPGSLVAAVLATDEDSGANGEVTYAVSEDDGDGLLFLNPVTGVFNLTRALDYEAQQFYVLTVCAQDGGGQSSSVRAYFNVLDVNDNPPVFGVGSYSASVVEGQPAGAAVLAFNVSDADDGVNAQLAYSVVSGDSLGQFTVDEQGVLRTLQALDRESQSFYNLVLQVHDLAAAPGPRFTSSTQVSIILLDVNDNPPAFLSPTLTYVPENTPVGTVVFRVEAVDPDSGPNSYIEYMLLSPAAGRFSVGTIDGAVRLTGELDREEVSNYTLTVVATDKGQPALSASSEVVVVVLDINDNSPAFAQASYVVDIPEDTLPGTDVAQVHAADVDEGANGQVRYSLADAGAGQAFRIDSVTGAIAVARPLDREETPAYALTVQAADRGSAPRVDTCTVHVRLLDVNDCTPAFELSPYAVTVPENLAALPSMVLQTRPALAACGARAPGHGAVCGCSGFLLQVVARDDDQGPNGRLSYLLVGGNEDEAFALSAAGELRVTRSLDRETQALFVLMVTATDAGSPALTGTGTVSVSVDDVNDNTPTFASGVYTTSVPEDAPTGTDVLLVSAVDADAAANAAIRTHSPLGLSGAAWPKSPQTQSVCPSSLASRAHGQRTLAWRPRPCQHGQRHGARPSAVPASTATAAATGSGRNGCAFCSSYRILGGDVPFTINPATGQVITSALLDREARGSYTLVVVSSDGGAPEPLSSSTSVLVTVTDVNDNPPRFQHHPYVTHVPAPTPPGGAAGMPRPRGQDLGLLPCLRAGTHNGVRSVAGLLRPCAPAPGLGSQGAFIFAVTVTDADAGPNAELHFSLSGRNAEQFRIDPQRGAVMAAGPLQGAAEVTFSVHVRDGGAVPRTDATTVTVRFADKADFPSVRAAERAFVFPESQPAGTVLTAVSGSSARGGPLSYYVASGNLGGTFQVDPLTGQVSIRRALDFEQTQKYVLWIEARDGGFPPFSSYEKLDVTVLDANDNAPVFREDPFACEILENLSPRKVLTVSALDRDSGPNGQLDYEIVSGNQEGSFSIGRASGEIRSTRALDRERTARYVLVVRASDRGVPPQSASASVVITVLDENDNAPRFSQIFSARVPEDCPLGHTVTRVTTSDEDTGANAVSRYSLADSGLPFAINPSTGDIAVSRPLDREHTERYRVRVSAHDSGWTVSTDVTVLVLDANDNAPRFSRPSYHLDCPELAAPGGLVTRVSASDPDAGANGQVFYVIRSPSEFFRIDAGTGEVFNKQPLRYRDARGAGHASLNRHSFVVTASDRGSPPLRSETTVTVTTVDGNDHAPRFLRPRYFTPVARSVPVGTRLIQVAAVDDGDFGLNSEVEYLLADEPRLRRFRLDRGSGWVSVAAPLASDLGQDFLLPVTARDKGTPPLSAQAVVHVTVTEENLHAPEFPQSHVSATVPESHSVGATVRVVSARDPDAAMNGLIRYAIAAGNELGLFAINASSGLLTLAGALDYERCRRHELTVSATDGGWVARTGYCTVTVDVLDVNDNSPVFTAAEYSPSVQENAPSGTTVLQLRATDADSGPHAVTAYALQASDSDLFAIDPNTGVLTTQGFLDFEARQSYQLTVKAFNVPDEERCGFARVLVRLQGANEYVPRFLARLYRFEVSEAAPRGTVVGEVFASDRDLGADGEVHYLLFGASRKKGFQVHRTTGQISVSGPLDREREERVTLRVLAKNLGSIRGADVDEATVNITVLDANDPPTFSLSVYRVQVSEAVPPGTHVAFVSAFDADSVPSWSQFSYALGAGSEQGAFSVHPQTGQVTVAAALDRETLPVYNLTVQAVDAGTPPATGRASLLVTLEDVNDNGPALASTEGAVMENQPPGTLVMTLQSTDPDLPPNQGPFSYQLLHASPAGGFFSLSAGGELTTVRELDREQVADFWLAVLVRDSGVPQMSSTGTVHVAVGDQNDNPSQPRAVEILVSYYGSAFPGGVLGSVKPQDPDVQDVFQCALTAGATSLFSIPRGTCDLRAQPRAADGTFDLTVRSSDGVHGPVSSSVRVSFSGFSNATLDNSVLLRLGVPTVSGFLAGHFLPFLRAAGAQLAGLGTAVQLYGAYEDGNRTFVLAAVRRGPGQYVRPSGAAAFFESAREALLRQSGVRLEAADHDACAPGPCLHGGSCERALAVGPGLRSLPSLPVVLVANEPLPPYRCHCAPGFAGGRCQLDVDECLPAPCHHGGTCHNLAGRFACSCPEGFAGQACERDVDECLAAPCRHGGSCRNFPGGFSCACRAGYTGRTGRGVRVSASWRCGQAGLGRGTAPAGVWDPGAASPRRPAPAPPPAGPQQTARPARPRARPPAGAARRAPPLSPSRPRVAGLSGLSAALPPAGPEHGLRRPGAEAPRRLLGWRWGQRQVWRRTCESPVDHCACDPCFHGGSCHSRADSYFCLCPFGVFGKHCELTSYGFEELSYMEFPGLDPNNNYIYVKFATVQSHALLLYSHDNQTGERAEFLALEVAEERLRFSYNLGGGTFRLTTAKKVSDGQFHTAVARRAGTAASLTVDSCSETQEPGFCTVSNAALSDDWTLDVQPNRVSVGGVRSLDPLLQRPGQVESHDFVGCVMELAVNGRPLEPSRALASQGILDQCPRREGACSPGPCQHGGACSDHWSWQQCRCREGLTGEHCERAPPRPAGIANTRKGCKSLTATRSEIQALTRGGAVQDCYRCVLSIGFRALAQLVVGLRPPGLTVSSASRPLPPRRSGHGQDGLLSTATRSGHGQDGLLSARAWRGLLTQGGSVLAAGHFVRGPSTVTADTALFLEGRGRLDYLMSQSEKRDYLLQQSLRGGALPEPFGVSSLEVKFRTRSEHGVLLHVQESSNYTTLMIRNGKVHFSSDAGAAGKVERTIPDVPVADGHWHTFLLAKNGSTTVLSLDGVHRREVSRPTQDFGGLGVLSISLGGAPPSQAHRDGETGFRGCIAWLRYGAESLPFSGKHSRASISRTDPSVKLGCRGPSVCASNPCWGDLLCVDRWHAYQCVPPGDCASQPCLNGGLCEPGPLAGFTCTCPESHTGRACETAVACLGVRCPQGRACQAGGPGGHVCVLSPGPEELSLPLWAVPAIVGSCATLLALLVLSLILCHQCRGRKARGATGEKPPTEKKKKKKGSENVAFDDPDHIPPYGDDMTVRKQPEGNPKPDIIERENPYLIYEETELAHGGETVPSAPLASPEQELEHYDIDNASSIAPSDADFVQHYRQFRSHAPKFSIQRHSPLGFARQSPLPLGSSSLTYQPPYGTGLRSGALGPPGGPTPPPLSRHSPAPFTKPAAASFYRHSPARELQLPLRDPGALDSDAGLFGYATRLGRRSKSPQAGPAPGSRPGSRLKQPIGPLPLEAAPPVGLSLEEVERLNAPRPRHPSICSADHGRSSSEEDGRRPLSRTRNPADGVPAPESSSDSDSHESFTCSEMEYDRDRPAGHASRVPKLSQVNESDADDEDNYGARLRPRRFHGRRAEGAQAAGAGEGALPAKPGPPAGTFDWDSLLSWGPGFGHYVDVFKDLASLPERAAAGEDAGQGPPATPGPQDGDAERYV
ncbi:Protocadherin Fat 4 [Galemys pyrenaicus]|uniref:Protocadherin Fat 4 n=1 Tax=Galemys pyrenaicus TaxID=202257 RepID=A0A8J5ZWY9_GALPY|nr:Protocadherin Fat 4 [Galemys pyrenaicus]